MDHFRICVSRLRLSRGRGLTLFLDQFLMLAEFPDGSAVEEVDAVADVREGSGVVRGEDDRPGEAGPPDRGLHQLLRVLVRLEADVLDQQDPRVPQQRSRQRQTQDLPRRHPPAHLLGHDREVSLQRFKLSYTQCRHLGSLRSNLLAIERGAKRGFQQRNFV